MKLRVGTFNLNTWRRPRGTEPQVWDYLRDLADVWVLTECRTPLPQVALDLEDGWSAWHLKRGTPGKSGWGTALVVRQPFGLEPITEINGCEIDRLFPGTIVAANVKFRGSPLFTLVGIHAIIRTGPPPQRRFLSSPAEDLKAMTPDLRLLADVAQGRLVVAGDFNDTTVPAALDVMRLSDPLAREFEMRTFRKAKAAPGTIKEHRLDYVLLSEALERHVVSASAGIDEHPKALSLSDHAPVILTLDLSVDRSRMQCKCGLQLRRPIGKFALFLRCDCGALNEIKKVRVNGV